MPEVDLVRSNLELLKPMYRKARRAEWILTLLATAFIILVTSWWHQPSGWICGFLYLGMITSGLKIFTTWSDYSVTSEAIDLMEKGIVRDMDAVVADLCESIYQQKPGVTAKIETLQSLLAALESNNSGEKYAWNASWKWDIRISSARLPIDTHQLISLHRALPGEDAETIAGWARTAAINGVNFLPNLLFLRSLIAVHNSIVNHNPIQNTDHA